MPIIIVASVAFLCGCASDAPPAARAELLAGYKAYAAADNDETIRLTDGFLLLHGNSGRGGEAYYLRGLAKDRLCDTQGARADWTESLRHPNTASIRSHAYLALGDIAWQGCDLGGAAWSYGQALRSAGARRTPSQYAGARLASLLQRQGNWRRADQLFSKIVRYFPRSPQAKFAKKRTGMRAWSIQVGAFTKRPNATELAKKLQTWGYTGDVQTSRHGKKTVYVVRAGRFETHANASRAVKDIQKRGAQAFIILTR